MTGVDFLKSLAVVDAEGRPTLLLVPGDREARLPSGWRLFEDADFAAHPSLVKGYIGPIGQQARTASGWWPTWRRGPPGAVDHRGQPAGPPRRPVVLGRDFTVDEWGSFAQVVSGDACPHCGGSVELVRSVEAAHTFQLGYKYSEVMPGSSFVTEDGSEAIFSMGCYGMGVSRLLAVVAEEHHDDRGLAWPAEARARSGSTWPRWVPGVPPRWPTPPTGSTSGWSGAGSTSSTTTGTCRPGSSSPTPTCWGCPSGWWSGPRAWPGASWSGGPGPPGRSGSSRWTVPVSDLVGRLTAAAGPVHRRDDPGRPAVRNLGVKLHVRTHTAESGRCYTFRSAVRLE